jgi:hypothetical protein
MLIYMCIFIDDDKIYVRVCGRRVTLHSGSSQVFVCIVANITIRRAALCTLLFSEFNKRMLCLSCVPHLSCVHSGVLQMFSKVKWPNRDGKEFRIRWKEKRA